MFCVNCFHKTTSVINSRGKKKQPLIWRRRKCPACGTVFTTHERPSLAENKKVSLANNAIEEFNIGKLTLSIAGAFTHAPKSSQYDSFWLAQTIEDTLSTQSKTLTPEDIAATAHHVLKKFDELAAVQYAAQHQLIISTKRRGRPSWREH